MTSVDLMDDSCTMRPETRSCVLASLVREFPGGLCPSMRLLRKAFEARHVEEVFVVTRTQTRVLPHIAEIEEDLNAVREVIQDYYKPTAKIHYIVPCPRELWTDFSESYLESNLESLKQSRQLEGLWVDPTCLFCGDWTALRQCGAVGVFFPLLSCSHQEQLQIIAKTAERAREANLQLIIVPNKIDHFPEVEHARVLRNLTAHETVVRGQARPYREAEILSNLFLSSLHH